MVDFQNPTTRQLTPYAFTCGYQEQVERQGVQIRLYQHGCTTCYVIEGYDFHHHTKLFYLTTPTHHQAYKQFRRACGILARNFPEPSRVRKIRKLARLDRELQTHTGV